ncbi:MAG: hypothetical protein J6D06_10890 [Clostridia bacterium]|nr:hypothetical protein [Clostridia bacterium]
MTILGIPLSKSIVIVMLVVAVFSFIFSIMSFMGKLRGKKKYTPDGVIKEDSTPDKKDNLTSGFLFLSLALTSAIGALKYLTNIAVFGYVAVALLLVSLVLLIVSEKGKNES